MSHKANLAYIKMALGLPIAYTLEMCEADCKAEHGAQAKVDYVWTQHELVEQICRVWNISRRRFIRSMAAPKPSLIAHLIFNDELMKFHGETLPNWPRGRGLIIPRWHGGRIETIQFRSLHEILKPKILAT